MEVLVDANRTSGCSAINSRAYFRLVSVSPPEDSVLDLKIAAECPSAIFESGFKRLFGGWGGDQRPDPTNAVLSLRVTNGRKPSQANDELAPPHSITRSPRYRAFKRKEDITPPLTGNRFAAESTVPRSPLGLGRVKTPWEVGENPRTGSVSGHDSRPSRLGPDDVHDPRQIIGQNRESHLGAYFWERFGEKVCCSHSGLHRAKRMLDCASHFRSTPAVSTDRRNTLS